jgi:hypothetical protein
MQIGERVKMSYEKDVSQIEINDQDAFERAAEQLAAQKSFVVRINKDLPYYQGVRRMVSLRQGGGVRQSTLAKMYDLLKFGGQFSVLSVGFSAEGYEFIVSERSNTLQIEFRPRSNYGIIKN